MRLGQLITELPKSSLPAAAADPDGIFAFYCSSPVPARTTHSIAEGEAVMMGTGGDATVHFGSGRFAYSTDTWAFRSSSPDVLTEYLWRWLQARLDLIDYRYFQGTGLRHLQKLDLRMIDVQVPSIADQERVVLTIREADEVVRRAATKIDKMELLRQGLLTDLLRCGIDEHGLLRDPSRDPSKFRDSPIGRIPATWNVLPMKRLLAPIPNAMRSGPFGSALLKRELRDEGIPLLGIDNVFTERFAAHYSRFVDEGKFLELRRYAVRPNDVMITIMGTVGRCAVVPNSIGRALSSKHVWTLTLDRSRHSPFLVCWQVNYAPWVLSELRRDEQGGVMAAIRSATLRSVLLPVPPKPELDAIEEIGRDITECIRVERVKLEKWRRIRTGLLHDLVGDGRAEGGAG